MSIAAMQAAGQHQHAPTSSYPTSSSSRQYLPQDEYYYQDPSPQSRQSRRNQQSSTSQRQYNQPDDSENYMHGNTAAHNATTIPIRSRSGSLAQDQYDGTPTVPARTTSQQSPASTASRQTRHGQHAVTIGNYNEPNREISRDDTATTSAGSARSRRKGPTSPEAPHRATSTREHNHQPSLPPQSRSEATMMSSPAPAPLVRENSEVIDRMIVSDPIVDEDRIRERIAEAQPMSDNGGLGLVPSEGVDDGGRGPQRRQDYSKSRRKEIQFGDYMLGQTLGEGEFGKVKLGWKKDGSSQVAIKLIRRESVATNPTRLPKIYREISILRDLAHPNIVRLHEMVQTERHIGIILEYASGGELFDYILNQRYLKDPAARRLFAQLVSGVGYLHKKGIVHRDLKLENLLLDQNKNIIITDFGFANTFNPVDELSPEIEYNLSNREFVRKYKLDRLDANGMRKGDLMQTSCGSPCYAAPELVVSDSLYTGRKVDVWSCGVILYAMLAGYLPFDDDPANPEGDNINLLYKYITSTPLTFPEYVSPHARDLLRRILVPDPRKRADLFEVARHSWLNEYHHVVAHITSSTTNIADIASSTVTTAAEDNVSTHNRSASVDVGSSTSAQQSHQQEMDQAFIDEQPVSSKREKTNRHTLQPEYVAPKTHTERAPTQEPIAKRTQESPAVSSLSASALSKPLPQAPPQSSGDKLAQNQSTSQSSMAAPTRPGRDAPRSTSEMAMSIPVTSNIGQANQYVPRPSTQGSLVSAGNTRSDLRLPSRGSYGQPVAPTVATANAQGKVTQPPKSSRGYNISGPQYQHNTVASIGQPMTTPMQPEPEPIKTHHRRSSTLSNLSERLFGRSNSVIKKERDEARQKSGKKYPPTAMKNPYPEEPAQSRKSSDSKRSFSFLRRKESAEVERPEEKQNKRFSLIPNSMSFKGMMGGSKDQYSDEGSQRMYSPDPNAGRTPPITQTPPVSGNDGQQERKYNNFSRPPQAQNYGHRTAASTNDIYGSTGVYNAQPQGQHHRQASHQPFQTPNNESYNPSRPSMSSTRNVLTKPNRKFNEAYDRDNHSGGSGAVKRVQDFFRRRGRARADSEYR